MLIYFTIENWMSFKDSTTFTMLATAEKRHTKRIVRLKKYNTKVLPISVLYGGNAAGKSNFVEAFSFAKSMVTHVFGIDAPIPRKYFYLSPYSKEKPSKFSFCILIEDSIYEFSFSVTSHKVIEEKLILFKNNKEEKLIYHRIEQNFLQKPTFENDENLEKRLNFVCEGTRENQLFLTNSIFQNINIYKKIYDWFAISLNIISPESKYTSLNELFDQEYKFHFVAENILKRLDTGISNLTYKNIDINNEDIVEIGKNVFDKIQNNKSICIGDLAFIRKDDDIFAHKLYTIHTGANNYKANFNLTDESDGTRRLFNLIPAFFCATGNNSIYIIDEADRSLHTLLVRQLLEYFLMNCSQYTRNQLIMTTHDVLLMDKKILRNDEMWVAERNVDGESKLIAFSEYADIKKDSNIQKSYLTGRIGGIPKIDIIYSQINKHTSPENDAEGEE